MLNSGKNAQECDATEAKSMDELLAPNKKLFHQRRREKVS
jgi:hypothetical protein